jgi:hypothetical protein
MSASPITLVQRSLAAMLCAGAIGAAAPAAQADQVSPLVVAARAPTSLAVRIGGLSFQEVRGAVHQAAYVVCRNAFANGDLGPWGDAWCPIRTTDAALRQYHALAKTGQATFASVVVQPAGRS